MISKKLPSVFDLENRIRKLEEIIKSSPAQTTTYSMPAPRSFLGYTVQEFKEYSGMGLNNIYALIKKGEINVIIADKTYIPVEEAERIRREGLKVF